MMSSLSAQLFYYWLQEHKLYYYSTRLRLMSLTVHAEVLSWICNTAGILYAVGQGREFEKRRWKNESEKDMTTKIKWLREEASLLWHLHKQHCYFTFSVAHRWGDGAGPPGLLPLHPNWQDPHPEWRGDTESQGVLRQIPPRCVQKKSAAHVPNPQ